jgi:hypothetical protein
MRSVVLLLGGYVAVACLVLVLATLAAAQGSPPRGVKLAPAPMPALTLAPAPGTESPRAAN